MRRARITGQAAVNRAVNDLLNKFEYPDELGGGGGFIGGGGAGMAHVLVVSDSEPTDIQRKADYVVPSSNTAVPLQSALDAIGGRVTSEGWTIWIAGYFDVGDDVTFPSGVYVRSLGAAFEGDGEVAFAAGAQVTNIQFGNDGGVAIAGGTGTQISGCVFGSACTLTKTTTGVLLITGNVFNQTSGTAITCDAGTGDFLTIVDNSFINGVDRAIYLVGTAVLPNEQIRIANNYFFSQNDIAIELEGSEEVIIANNTFLDPDNGGIVTDANCQQLTIVGNQIFGTPVGPGINCQAPDSTIADNYIQGSGGGDPAQGILVEADLVTITGNHIKESDGHGIEISGNQCSIVGNNIDQPGLDTDDTYDGINLDGDDNTAIANSIRPSLYGHADTRYGINIVGGNENVVFANSLGDSSEYGTADSVDSGTGTILAASGGVIGGQFAY